MSNVEGHVEQIASDDSRRPFFKPSWSSTLGMDSDKPPKCCKCGIAFCDGETYAVVWDAKIHINCYLGDGQPVGPTE